MTEWESPTLRPDRVMPLPGGDWNLSLFLGWVGRRVG